MTPNEIRERQRTSPEWLAVEMVARIEALEAKVAELTRKPRRGRPPKNREA